MRRSTSLFGILSMVGLGTAGLPFLSAPQTHRVQVHCPTGKDSAFVTPPSLQIARGDSVEWRTTGQVAADSITITLKDEQPPQRWPFRGTPPHGGSSVRASAANRTGTYRYNVTMQCRVPGGGLQEAIVDPDIIII